jgi:GNAT superfamily N-acetyltransferase
MTIRLVAEVPQAGIVGFLNGGPERSGDPQYTGEIHAIYLLQSHHRIGLGSGLIRAWAAEMLASGVNTAMVWALADNHRAAAFYHRLGAKRLREQPLAIAGISAMEVAWGWDDLSKLV